MLVTSSQRREPTQHLLALQGVLRRVDKVKVSDLQRLSAQMGGPWNPTSYLHFLDTVLAWMKDCAGGTPPRLSKLTAYSMPQIWASMVDTRIMVTEIYIGPPFGNWA